MKLEVWFVTFEKHHSEIVSITYLMYSNVLTHLLVLRAQHLARLPSMYIIDDIG